MSITTNEKTILKGFYRFSFVFNHNSAASSQLIEELEKSQVDENWIEMEEEKKREKNLSSTACDMRWAEGNPEKIQINVPSDDDEWRLQVLCWRESFTTELGRRLKRRQIHLLKQTFVTEH